MNLVNKAIAFAEKAHRGQFRKYNTDVAYFVHPVRVYSKLLQYDYTDTDILCAALLHDTIEDCGVTIETIEREFNVRTGSLVIELTQADKMNPELKGKPRSERHAANIEKLIQVSSCAKAIKICDRWDNLEDINLNNPECVGFLRRRYLQESWDIYKVIKDSDWGLSYKLSEVIRNLSEELGVELK